MNPPLLAPEPTSPLPVPLSLSAGLEAGRINLSVEEENLASFPFAVLEQRVGKKLAKLEVKGRKTLPDGTEMSVVWQVQGSPELGLPTEQDLDIFVAIGVLTFRSHFSKTVVFQGREIARILNMANVHGKFYDRLKLAMDRLIALRFRAVAQTDRSEDVKWTNIFQEASFTANRDTGRCEGSVTWTDKIIHAMDSGFFRLFDTQRYMQLDGLTAKHMYRYLAVAFESTDVVIADLRTVATQYLAIPKPPAYFSRLLQTVEPALEQLLRQEIVGSWHVVSKADWRIAIRRHRNYIPERQVLLSQPVPRNLGERREQCRQMLQQAGLEEETIGVVCEKTSASIENYDGLERAARLLAHLIHEEVLPHVAAQLIGEILQSGTEYEQWRESLDWLEIGVLICEQKRRRGRPLRNGAGLIVKLARDTEARSRLVGTTAARGWQSAFRNREEALARQHAENEERFLLADYEQFREEQARQIMAALPEETQTQLRNQKRQQSGMQDWLTKLNAQQQREEIERAVLADIARQHLPRYEKWRLRRAAQQVLLPFLFPPEQEEAAVSL